MDHTQQGEGPQWVAVAAVVVRGDELLCMRRSVGRVGAGLWETVSGRVRPGEDPLEAIQREVAEETGLVTRITARPVDAYPARRGDEPMIVLVYRADVISGDLVRSEEHDAHAWLDIETFAATTTLTRLVTAARRALAAHPG
jgi:8-oxo-dGTP pyrophosphatase MutT (NUDIX family)